MMNKKVTVIGLGSSALNAARLLKDAGALARVTESGDNDGIKSNAKLLESLNIPFEIGGHTKDFIAKSDLVVASPGVEDSSPAIKWANGLGIPIISELELGYSFCKGRIIGITGTNGKSTVTTLIGRIIKDGRLDAVTCGNIGNSLSGEIGRIKKDTWVVLEVSSFQLERISKFRPDIAVILNIRDDHLDRYAKFSDYFKEKLKIFGNQDKKDILILNRDAKELDGLADLAKSKVLYYSRCFKANGAYIKDGTIVCIKDDKEYEICSTKDISLKGLHNVENVLVSSLAGLLAGVEPASIKNTIQRFKGLDHRFETVDTIDGIEYIDDSKGTTVDSTYRALESCERPVVLIAGGKDKRSDYTVIRELVRSKVRHLIVLGEASGR
ncbi:MAG: UDP-N-acetylmuramoyl-L-alanine--D-glutamate ligase, partial [Candidatus Omnitrophica bacterium]|nr:UDP-N-acetylmuramoyl-L-alanine--D-glutamate ligase [Candidatus Omnitrophota bacterium]